MELDELRTIAAELFPMAVEHAIAYPGKTNEAYDKLHAMCWVHFKPLGFDCMADCFGAVVPKSESKLNLQSWSEAEIKVQPWTVRIRCRPLRYTEYWAHLELHHDGPLPGITETGYRSMFEPMATFGKTTPEAYIRAILDALPQSQQLSLF